MDSSPIWTASARGDGLVLNGEDAIESAAKKARLGLMDIILPGEMDGVDAARLNPVGFPGASSFI